MHRSGLLGRQKSKPFEGVLMQQTKHQPLFSHGQIVATPGALAALEKAGQQSQEFLSRHVCGQWGDLCEEDRRENQFSLERRFRILSSYRTNAGEKIWIITESDRSVTAILLPAGF